ncbi:MAG TPA: DNA replication/repair protein RecF [Candidatus Nanopelagicaceae bacterium]
MHLSHLSLKNFRSYSELELPLTPGITIFLGRNGEGKTNIVESILYLAFLSSHRTAGDQPLVKLGENAAYVRASIQNPEREILVELEINSERANRARINQNPVRSQKELFGLVKSIYFSPEDLDLVRGDPSERRRFIDQLLILQSPRLAGVITDYERALKQRNSLLKTRASYSSLESWDQQVAKLGGEIIAARLSLLNNFEPLFSSVYTDIAPEKPAHITYKSSLEELSTDPISNSQTIIKRMFEIRSQEIDRGLTLVGPHRDDLLLQLGDQPVKGYASHGESWSIALSLKLAAYKSLLLEGAKPILILDDVFSELDEERRAQLVSLANSAEQTFITVAVEADLPRDLFGTIYQVRNGSVKVKT